LHAFPGLEHREIRGHPAVTKKPDWFALYQGTASAGPQEEQELSGFSPCGLLLREVGQTIGKLFRRIYQASLYRVVGDVSAMLAGGPGLALFETWVAAVPKPKA
jgi:hypothetical protein